MKLPESSSIDAFIQRAGELYSLPRVAVEILELTRQPTVDARQLKQCLEKDPALTVKLLRVVNSALFGLSRPVGDLNQALTILGTKPLKLLVLGFSLPDGFFKNLAREWLARYWQQTLVKAVAAREITPLVSRACGDEAFIAGLLQDIGTLALIQDLGPAYLQMLEQAREAGLEAGCVERRVLGFDHTLLSARLLAHWKLPEPIVEAAYLPGSPEEIDAEEARQQPLRYIVYLADLLARLLVGSQSYALEELLAATRETSDLDEQQLAALVERLQTKVPELAKVLSLDVPSTNDYREVLTQAYAQLATLAGDAAGDLIRGQQRSALERIVESTPALVPGKQHSAAANASDKASPSARGADVNEGVLLARIHQALSHCRQHRLPLSLLLVDANDSFPQAVCKRLVPLATECLPARGNALAMLLRGSDRQEAVRLGRRLLQSCRELTAGGTSIGIAAIALPSRNFPPGELLVSAERCLSGARASGGNCLKSIES